MGGKRQKRTDIIIEKEQLTWNGLLRCRIKDHTLNNQEEKDESGNEYAKSKIRNRCGEQRLFSGEPFRNEKRKSGESLQGEISGRRHL